MQELTTFLSNHPYLTTAAIVLLALLFVIELIRNKRLSFNITPAQATKMINHDNAVVIDTRNVDSYRKGHIIDAQSIPATEVNANNKKLEKYKSRPIIMVCATGTESQKIAALLLKQGYNAYSLAGGLRAWSAAEMPLVKE